MALVSSKFSPLSTSFVKGVKRTEQEQAPSNRVIKAPRASDVIIMAPQPKSDTNQRHRLPMDAPVEVCIYRYCKQASLIWDLLQGRDEMELFQVQISHDVQRPITYDIRNSFNDFLFKSHEDCPQIPVNLQQLEKEAAVKMIVTDRTDPDGVGFRQWRTAFYCVDLLNFMLLLDGWFKYKENSIAREHPFQIELYHHSSCDIVVKKDEFIYEHYNLHAKAHKVPLHVFHVQPVVGKRITTLNIQITNDNIFDLVITGHNWPFRSDLDAFGVHGGYQGVEKDARQYVRIWKDINITDNDMRRRFMDMIETTFKGLCLRVILDQGPIPATEMTSFIDILSENHSLFFMRDDDM